MMRTLPGIGTLTLFRLVRSFVDQPARKALLRPMPDDMDLFAAIPATRSGAALDHILYVGPLSPESGAADLLVALSQRAEQHPGRRIELTWAGVGDLAGVFEAQPLPGTLTQHFVGVLDRTAMAVAFAGASLLVVPLVDGGAPVLEALAAGLIVLGGRRVLAMRPILGSNGPGWGYDERGRLDLAATLSAALDETPAAQDNRRRAGRVLALGAPVADAVRRSAQQNRFVSSEVAL